MIHPYHSEFGVFALNQKRIAVLFIDHPQNMFIGYPGLGPTGSFYKGK